jgi:hypothetical protein
MNPQQFSPYDHADDLLPISSLKSLNIHDNPSKPL